MAPFKMDPIQQQSALEKEEEELGRMGRWDAAQLAARQECHQQTTATLPRAAQGARKRQAGPSRQAAGKKTKKSTVRCSRCQEGVSDDGRLNHVSKWVRCGGKRSS